MTAVDSNGDIDYDRLTRLSYLDAVVSETLRLHTPVIRINRKCNEDYKISKLSLTLPKGSGIQIPLYAIHHNPHFYPDPFKFNPDRFLPENRHKLIPYTYLPFAAGPRNCIGMRFALMEAKLALAKVVLRYRLFRTTNTSVPLQFRNSSKAYGHKSVIIGIERRL